MKFADSPSATSLPFSSSSLIVPSRSARDRSSRAGICSSGRSSVTQPASLEHTSRAAANTEAFHDGELGVPAAGADEISSRVTLSTSYLARTVSGSASIMM